MKIKNFIKFQKIFDKILDFINESLEINYTVIKNAVKKCKYAFKFTDVDLEEYDYSYRINSNYYLLMNESESNMVYIKYKP